eukprot:scaffold116951_cov66-Phaeocystis_antarctica.AAC.3
MHSFGRSSERHDRSSRVRSATLEPIAERHPRAHNASPKRGTGATSCGTTERALMHMRHVPAPRPCGSAFEISVQRLPSALCLQRAPHHPPRTHTPQGLAEGREPPRARTKPGQPVGQAEARGRSVQTAAIRAQDGRILLVGPRLVLYVRVDLVAPAQPTLLAAAPMHGQRDGRPPLGTDLDHGALEHVVLLGGPRLAGAPALGVALGIVSGLLLLARELSLRCARAAVLWAGRRRRALLRHRRARRARPGGPAALAALRRLTQQAQRLCVRRRLCNGRL